MHLICQSWLSNIVHHPVSVCDHVADWELQLALPSIVGNVVPTSQSRKALKFNMILLNVSAYRREKKVQVRGYIQLFCLGNAAQRYKAYLA